MFSDSLASATAARQRSPPETRPQPSTRLKRKRSDGIAASRRRGVVRTIACRDRLDRRVPPCHPPGRPRARRADPHGALTIEPSSTIVFRRSRRTRLRGAPVIEPDRQPRGRGCLPRAGPASLSETFNRVARLRVGRGRHPPQRLRAACSHAARIDVRSRASQAGRSRSLSDVLPSAPRRSMQSPDLRFTSQPAGSCRSAVGGFDRQTQGQASRSDVRSEIEDPSPSQPGDPRAPPPRSHQARRRSGTRQTSGVGCRCRAGVESLVRQRRTHRGLSRPRAAHRSGGRQATRDSRAGELKQVKECEACRRTSRAIRPLARSVATRAGRRPRAAGQSRLTPHDGRTPSSEVRR